MKRPLAIAAGFLAATGALGTGCGPSSDIPKLEVKPYQKLTGGTAVATVAVGTSGQAVELTSKDLDERVNRSAFQSPAEVTLDKKKEFLDELIQNEVLYEEARAKGYAEHPRVKLMMISLLEHDAMSSVPENDVIPEKEIQTYFRTHHDQFVIPERVRARRIVILFGADKNESRKRAEEIRKECLANPNDFGKIAVDKSEGPEKTRQGELGYFADSGRPGLDPKIVSVAFGLKNNDVSQVFETSEGWNVVKVENRAARAERPYDQVKKSIEHQLVADRKKALLDNYVAELKNKAKIAVNDGALASYSPVLQPRPVFNPAMMGVDGHPGGLMMPGQPGGPQGIPPGLLMPPQNPPGGAAPAPGNQKSAAPGAPAPLGTQASNQPSPDRHP